MATHEFDLIHTLHPERQDLQEDIASIALPPSPVCTPDINLLPLRVALDHTPGASQIGPAFVPAKKVHGGPSAPCMIYLTRSTLEGGRYLSNESSCSP